MSDEKVFVTARVRLTFWYVIITTAVSLLFSILIFRSQVAEIDRFAARERLRNTWVIPGPESDIVLFNSDFVQDAKDRVTNRLLAFNLIVMLASAGLGYFLAGRSLAPVVSMLDEQKQFVSDAAHELRTPLTAMKASLEVFMRQPKATQTEMAKLVNDNIKDIENLEVLTNSLLTLSRLSEAESASDKDIIDIGDVIEEVVHSLAPITTRRGQSVSLDIHPYFMEGSRQEIVQLMTILVENAVKYTPVKIGKISIQTTQQAKKLILTIRDNGIGISKKDLPYIFDRFYRGDKSRTKNTTKGYGLGLSIAKNIVSLHQGSIKVASKVGKGTTFTLTFPLFS